MDERRKKAYLWLMHLAINHLRGFDPGSAEALQKSRMKRTPLGTREVVDPLVHRKVEDRLRAVADLAYAFHNLPRYAMDDFSGWDEDAFWRCLHRMVDEHGLYGYFRAEFERYLSHPQHP